MTPNLDRTRPIFARVYMQACNRLEIQSLQDVLREEGFFGFKTGKDYRVQKIVLSCPVGDFEGLINWISLVVKELKEDQLIPTR